MYITYEQEWFMASLSVVPNGVQGLSQTTGESVENQSLLPTELLPLLQTPSSEILCECIALQWLYYLKKSHRLSNLVLLFVDDVRLKHSHCLL